MKECDQCGCSIPADALARYCCYCGAVQGTAALRKYLVNSYAHATELHRYRRVHKHGSVVDIDLTGTLLAQLYPYPPKGEATVFAVEDFADLSALIFAGVMKDHINHNLCAKVWPE